MKVCRLCRRYAAGGAETCAFDGGELLEGPVPPFAPGDSLGDYSVKRALFAGQTGVVLECLAEGEDEESVLIKVFNQMAGGAEARRKVLESAAALTMDGLHPVEELFEYEGRLCGVMEQLEGATLASSLKQEGPMEPKIAVELGQRLCETLLVVHESGLAHYDIRPGHLFVRDGETPGDVVLLDLGSPSPPGRLGAPERFDNKAHATKTDIYGVCVTLYVALAGRSPFRTDAVDELTWLVHNAPAPPLRVIRKTGSVDPALERLIIWGMAKDPLERPTLEQLTEAFAGLAEGDYEQVETILGQAEAAKKEAEKQREEERARARMAVMRSPRPAFLDDDNPTMRMVRKILPASMLKSTGLTQSFFVDGEQMEREVAQLAFEEAQARRENLSAWIRLITLLLIALVLGGVTVWALTH